MKTFFKNKKPYLHFLAFVLIVSSSLLTSCFGPKNLVTKQRGLPQYDFVGDTLEGWALVRQDSLWGFVSEEGSRTIRPMFLWAMNFADGMALTKDKRGYRYINSQGKLLRRVKAPHAYSFAEGLAPIKIKDKWGYINRKGKVEIKPQFDWAKPFHENRAEVSIGLRKGYINKNGQLIIPAIYEETSAFKNGLAIVRKDFRYGMIDTLGNFVLPNHFDEIKRWETDFYRLGIYTPTTLRVSKFGLADADGKLLLHTQYTSIDLQAQHYIRVEKENLYGLCDRKGDEIIPLEYTYLGVMGEERFLAAEKQGRWGFLDMQGKVLLPFDYQLSISAAEGRIWVHRDSISILLDNQFREISRFSKYNRVYPFSNGYAAVSIKDTSDYYGNLYGYIDRDGHEVVVPQFDGVAYDANPYRISVVGKKSYGIVGQYIFNIQERGVIDEQRYSNLKRFGPMLFNSYGDFLSSKTGRPIENFPYQSINPLTGDRRDLAMVRREGKVGLVDTTLTELFPLEYDDISSFHQNRVKIKRVAVGALQTNSTAYGSR